MFITYTSGQLLEVNQKLRIFFDVWKSGRNELLPRLDPFEVTHAAGNYDIPTLSVHYVTNNIHVTGFKNFNIRSLDTSSDNLSAAIIFNIPLITINADEFDINCSAFYFFKNHCHGKQIDIIIYNMDLTIRMQLGVISTKIYLESLDLEYKVDNVEINLPECSWGLSSLLNSIGVNMLYESQKDINNAVQKNIMPFANQYLENVTLEQLLRNIDQFIAEGDIPIESKLLAFLEIWKAGTNAILPPLSPILIPDLNDIYYETSTVTAMFAANGVNIHGLNSFIINSLDVSREISTLAIYLNVPKITISADSYLLKGRAFFVYNFECSGNMNITLHNVELDALINVGSSNIMIDYAAIMIRPTNTEVNMASCPSIITNLINSEINNMLKSEQDSVSNFLNDQLVRLANDFFGHMSLDDVLTFIDDVTYDYFKH